MRCYDGACDDDTKQKSDRTYHRHRLAGLALAAGARSTIRDQLVETRHHPLDLNLRDPHVGHHQRRAPGRTKQVSSSDGSAPASQEMVSAPCNGVRRIAWVSSVNLGTLMDRRRINPPWCIECTPTPSGARRGQLVCKTTCALGMGVMAHTVVAPGRRKSSAALSPCVYMPPEATKMMRCRSAAALRAAL